MNFQKILKKKLPKNPQKKFPKKPRIYFPGKIFQYNVNDIPREGFEAILNGIAEDIVKKILCKFSKAIQTNSRRSCLV